MIILGHFILIAILGFLGWYKLWLALIVLCGAILITSSILYQNLEETKDGTWGKRIGGGIGTLLGVPMMPMLGKAIGSTFDDNSELRESLWANYFGSIIINFLLTGFAINLLKFLAK